MKPPCEIIVSRILPQVRALVAIDLKERYHLPGKQIAILVGTTEAAISQYVHRVRGQHDGFLIDFPEIPLFVEKTSSELFENRETGIELVEKLGDLCGTLRNNERFIEMYSEGKGRATCGICFRDPDKQSDQEI